MKLCKNKQNQKHFSKNLTLILKSENHFLKNRVDFWVKNGLCKFDKPQFLTDLG